MRHRLEARPLADQIAQLRKKLRSRAIELSFAAGLVLIVCGSPYSDRLGGVIALGIGTSTFASALFARLAFARDDLIAEIEDLGVERLFTNRRIELDDPFWLDLISKTREHYSILGVANHGYISSDPTARDFEAALKGALTRHSGLRLEVLWLDPRTQLAQRRGREEGRNVCLDTLDSIAWFRKFKHSVPNEASRVSMKVYDETPTCGITWTEQQIVVTHYQARKLNLDAPGIILDGTVKKFMNRHSPLSEVYVRNYQQVLSEATEIDDALYAELEKNRAAYGAGNLPSEAQIRKQRDQGVDG